MSRTSQNLILALTALWCLPGVGVWLSWGLDDLNLPIWIVVLGPFAIIGGMLPMLIGRDHGGRLVVWFRRFGDTDELAGHLNRWHGRILDEASKGIALPVTLQDESVDAPPAVTSAVFLPVLLIGLFGSLGAMLWVFELPWFETIAGRIAGFFLAVLAVTGPGLAAVVIGRRLGATRVAPGEVGEAALRSLRGRRSRKGMLVLECETQHWQTCVEELLDSADLALVDATVMSDNVEWEIETAFERLGPRSVLLLSAITDPEANAEPVESDGWSLLSYDLATATEEIAAFSKKWMEDEHERVDPSAPLGLTGTALAREITRWMKTTVEDGSS